MALIGYIASFFIGISLGLIGGGGSILTVPVMVYFFSISPLAATSYSLVIVGITSFAGSIQGIKKKQVDFKTAFLFGGPSIITVFITRKFFLPRIPATISILQHTVSFGIITMVLFALLMIAASFSMIGKQSFTPQNEQQQQRGKLILSGIGIGLITGFLGAGGGFLLIPALVLWLNLPIKEAVATSLFIIAINSTVGFLADVGHITIDYRFLFTVAAIAIAGVISGGILNTKLDARILRSGFGWFVLAMGCIILVKEILMPG